MEWLIKFQCSPAGVFTLFLLLVVAVAPIAIEAHDIAYRLTMKLFRKSKDAS